MKLLNHPKKAAVAAGISPLFTLVPLAPNMASATGSANYNCGTTWSYISGSRVHSETYKSGSASCQTYKARARAGNQYSSWDSGNTEAHKFMTKDPTSNGGTHQLCVGSSCSTKYT